MSYTCTATSFPIKVPHTLFHSRKFNDVFPKNQILGTLSFSSKKNSRFGFTNQTISLSQCCSQTNFLSTMDEDCKLEVSSTDIPEGYCKELEIAVRAVHMACLLCQRVQDNLLSKTSEQVHSKEDNSPVTIADWSVQAIVSWVLSEAFGSENVAIVAEEDVEVLSKPSSVGLLEAVVRTVNECLADAPRFGLKGPGTDLDAKSVLAAISRCNLAGARGSKFWVLDPVDGTLGFVRGDQYAIALALIEDGEPVLGVLGCPNYPMKKEWLSYQNGYRRILSRLTSQTSVSGDRGSVLYARKGGGKAWMQPLLYGEKNFVWPNSAKQIKVSSIDNPALATFCEPVEIANSSHSFTAGLAHSVGLRNQPLRVYSMVKYAAIARGDAEIFMKFARAGYKEKIWDHAAGVLIIEEAGGVVTDAGGRPLDFSKGVYLEGLDRGIIACAGAKLHENNVDEYLNRIKLGHWPVFPASSICLEIVVKKEKEGLEENVVLVEGNFDGPDEGISGLVHLASLKFLTLRPVTGHIVPSCLASIRLRVEILRSAFDACESLLDTSRQLWKKSMMHVMAWLRPEVVTSEARYGYEVAAHSDVGLASGLAESSASRKCSRFDVASFYEAIKPSKEEPMLDDNLPGLLPKLRPYQRRAAYWMVQREKRNFDGSLQSKINRFISPLCMQLSLIETSMTIYYNPFCGNVSLHAEIAPPVVPGGILADEMGLGKTVELLACIFTHPVASSCVGNFTGELLCDEGQKNSLKRLKRERVECICGSVSESIRYKGLWVQCDVCDAWQHADCVGYSPKKKYAKCEAILNGQQSTVNMCKRAKRKNDVKIVEMEGCYICEPCSELIQATVAPVATGATLIVCPAPILPQWHAEIVRHTNPDVLKTCIYEGVRTSSLSQMPLPDIDELLSADIVLTTYDVLKEDLSHDSDRHEGDRRAMRFEKRYPVIPTLLTRILWWRICLDEAQMVETNAAAATEMALRLHGVHRWCITGTPIQRKLDDLFGLLRFLNASPFNIFRWWTDIIRDPYEKGDSRAMAFTHDFFKHLMWRSSKVNVADELQLPPQEECVSWLSLSPIEEHFYQRQHETCVNDACELIESFKNDIYKRKAPGSQLEDAASDVVITNIEAAKLFNSLLKLRQACCHPQVGSSGLRSLQQSPMTMEEILSVLVSKTKVEGEEALRRLVVALNALAGIAIINQNYSQAVSLYQEALALAEDHFEDFRLDPLLNIHITHNLAEILPLSSDSSKKLESAPGSPRDKVSNMEDAGQSNKGALHGEDKIKEESILVTSSGDPSNLMSNSLAKDSVDENSETKLKLSTCTSYESLRTACERLKKKFLSVFSLKLAGVQQEFKKSYDQVCNAFTDRKNQYSAWWLEVLHHIEQNKDSSNELIRKIGEAVSGTLNTSRASKVASCFRSITALKIYIQSGLDSLESSRESLLVKLFEIDKTMGNPRKEDIARVRYCPECYADADGVLCVHCELNDLFQVYEARLFRLNKGKRGEVITSAEEAVDLQKKKSALNRFYTTLARTDKNSGSATAEYEDFGKKRDLEDIMVSKAPSDLEVVLGLIKSNSRGLLDAEGVLAAKKQLQLLEGMRKEYAQARLLSTAQAHVLRAHDEIMMATSRLRLKEDENDKSIDALDQGELDAASAEWSSEKFFFLSSLSRTKGQLRYLKGLVQSKQNNHCASSENSTIAQATMDSAAHAEEKTEHQARTEERTCPVCQEKLNNQKMVFQCGHVICCKCLFAMTEQRLALHGKPQVNWLMCPTCRQHTDCRNIAYADDSQNKSYPSSSIASENSEASVNVRGSYSTKIEAVTRRILWITSSNLAAKVLVFSSWNDVLDVLEHAFAANNITFVRMKGGRKAHVAISQFRGLNSNVKETGKRHAGQPETRSIQVLLLLIQHGANGLNLLEAQHVILVEPLLNPAAEAQAIGRVHRIGQAHKTLVHRFIVKDTVEESLYKLNRSRNIGSFVSGNRKNQDQPILTLRDVESLFRVAPSTDEKATGSLTHLPPSVAAAIAAERRLSERTSCQEPPEHC